MLLAPGINVRCLLSVFCHAHYESESGDIAFMTIFNLLMIGMR